MKLVTIIGTRPQVVKLSNDIKQVIVNTGQHYSQGMRVEDFKKDLKLPKIKYNLGCTELGEMITKCKEVLTKECATHVLVYGDTNSTLAGAIAAKECKCQLIHVEAGMRCGNMTMREEQNRIMVDHISDVLLCVSDKAVKNLEEEKIQGQIGMCGNVVLDTLFSMLPTKENKKGTYNLLTLHRAENVDNKEILKEILKGIGESKERFIYPIHPRTKKRIEEYKIKLPINIEVIKPVVYKEMVNLIAHAQKVVTDSGGLQCEAHFLMTPCITMRSETEWIETVEEEWNVLVGNDKDTICNAIINTKKTVKKRDYIYGKGDAKDRIKNYINSL